LKKKRREFAVGGEKSQMLAMKLYGRSYDLLDCLIRRLQRYEVGLVNHVH
jgi:hypothetical protein